MPPVKRDGRRPPALELLCRVGNHRYMRSVSTLDHAQVSFPNDGHLFILKAGSNEIIGERSHMPRVFVVVCLLIVAVVARTPVLHGQAHPEELSQIVAQMVGAGVPEDHIARFVKEYKMAEQAGLLREPFTRDQLVSLVQLLHDAGLDDEELRDVIRDLGTRTPLSVAKTFPIDLPCNDYIAGDEQDRELAKLFLRIFLTGANMARAVLEAPRSGFFALAAMDNADEMYDGVIFEYCTDNPEDSFTTALDAAVKGTF